MMTMDEMMQECRKRCQETAMSIDQTMKTLEEANQSNYSARMRAANDQTQTARPTANHFRLITIILLDIAYCETTQPDLFVRDDHLMVGRLGSRYS
jgi:hypothetical protein